MNNLDWLEGWYLAKCDGDWEHQHGPVITTLDNPGWSVLIPIDLKDGLALGLNVEKKGEVDWFFCKTTETQFQGFGGPTNLGDILDVFRRWVEASTDKEIH